MAGGLASSSALQILLAGQCAQRRAPPDARGFVVCESLTAPSRFAFHYLLPFLFPSILREQFRFLAVQRALAQEVGPPLERASQLLHQAPAAYRRVMSRQQHVRNALALEALGTRVMRAIEQPRDERILHCRLRVVQNAGPLPHDRVDQHQRRQLAPRHDEIANRDFLIDLTLDKALVDALVASCQQYVTRSLSRRRKLGDAPMRQWRARRRQVNR